jgi:Ca-activated chloride channel family protein
MIFASPAWLLALLLLPLAAALEGWLAGRDRERLARLVSRPLWQRVVRRSGEGWRFARLALALLGAGLVIVALARPQWGIIREKVEREGVDVVLVLDTSASMSTRDVPPSRFFLARQALLQLVARLQGDRFALVAFEGEAYPLVPLTLDADAVGLFLETAEPGIVPAPGTSLGLGLAKGLAAFVDTERRNKVMVLVSDGEDLEGEIEAAVQRAGQAGVVVDSVGVGTEAGAPVPELDAQGRVTGYKRDRDGSAVVSRINMQTLEAIARGTGGQAFRITPQDTSLSRLAAAIEGMEQKTLAREYAYRRKEQFQLPLGLGLVAIIAAGLLPPPPLRRRTPRESRFAARAAFIVLALGACGARADAQAVPDPAPSTSASARQGALGAEAGHAPAPAGEPKAGALDEILLRARRATSRGRSEYARGNHPDALAAFERAAAARPQDPAVRFNVADALYKNGRYDEAATLYRALGADPRAKLAAASRFNLGNSLYQKQDYRRAVAAYRDALRTTPGDADTRHNLELALQALREQEQRQKQQQRNQQQKQDQKPAKGQDQQGRNPQEGERQRPEKQDRRQGQPAPQKAQSPAERADERFREETGMPRERAMQLLDALQQNEMAEQKKLLALKRAQKRKGKDW